MTRPAVYKLKKTKNKKKNTALLGSSIIQQHHQLFHSTPRKKGLKHAMHYQPRGGINLKPALHSYTKCIREQHCGSLSIKATPGRWHNVKCMSTASYHKRKHRLGECCDRGLGRWKRITDAGSPAMGRLDMSGESETVGTSNNFTTQESMAVVLGKQILFI